MSLHIEGRRWFQRGPGNTYHTVRIFGLPEHLWDAATAAYVPAVSLGDPVKLGPVYGYGDAFLQTAIEWLREHGYPQAEYGTQYLREVLGGSYSVIDVGREKDL